MVEGKAGFSSLSAATKEAESQMDFAGAQFPTCPECGSIHVVQNGYGKLKSGQQIPVLFCKECGRKFRQKYLRFVGQISPCQIGALREEAKNLGTATENESVASDEKTLNGKVTEFLFKLEKSGYAKETRRLTATCLKILVERGASLSDPESVKEVLAKQTNAESAYKNRPWSSCRKRNMINAYTQFLKFISRTWDPPKNTVTRKIPFIPTEKEIDDLIAGSPNAVATILQLMKETAMRSGEAVRLGWVDVDFERRTVKCNDPEKGSKPRVFGKPTEKLMLMLSQMPKVNRYVFGESSLNSLKATYGRSRKRLAYKLGNPRLLEIHFHTLRHWKATMEYHRTKDLLHVKRFLGHVDVKNTELYIELDQQLFQNQQEDSFTCKIAHTTSEASKLVEVGFEFVAGDFNNGGMIFRKRK